jgi:hypothetical protein
MRPYFFGTGEDRMYDPWFFNVTIPKVNSKFPTIS